MRFPFAIIGLLALCACTAPVAPPVSDDQSSSSASEASSSIATVIVDTGSWLHYRSDLLDLEFSYPPTYTIYFETGSSITFYRGDTPVVMAIEDLYLGDGMPEGYGIHIERTHDASILETLDTPDTHFTGTKMWNGLEYRVYTYEGMGVPTIYLTTKNGYFYVVTARWDTEEQLVRTIRIGLE